MNGIDTKSYDPATDPNLAENYTAANFKTHKLACKKDLQSIFGLHDWPVPVLAMVTRLVGHKGVDLVRHVAQEVVNNGIQLVVLGSGESEYEAFSPSWRRATPGRWACALALCPAWRAKCTQGQICS